jgi:hypothetical protein
MDLVIRTENEAQTGSLANAVIPTLVDRGVDARRVLARPRGFASEPITTAILVAVATTAATKAVEHVWKAVSDWVRRTRTPVEIFENSPGSVATRVTITVELAEGTSPPGELLAALSGISEAARDDRA